MTTTTPEAIIHGTRCEIREGDVIWIESWAKAGRLAYARLLPCEWDAAQFRVEAGNTGMQLAVNVEFSGRKCRYDVRAFDGPAIRVAVTFVADGDDESVTVGGFVEWNKVADR